MNTENSNETPEDRKTDKWGYVVCFGTIIIFVSIRPFL